MKHISIISARDLTLAVLLLLASSPGAVVQAQTEESLLACDRIVDTAEKMACFDAIVRELKRDDEVPVVESESEPAQVPPSKSDAAPAAAITADSVEISKSGGDLQAPIDANASASQAGLPAEVDGSDESANAIAEFGLEDQMADEQKENTDEQAEQSLDVEFDTIHATIVDSWSTIDARFEVRLDNGQVWRETELTRTSRLPKAGMSVRITKGSFGSYHMKLGSNNRLAGVRRTE